MKHIVELKVAVLGYDTKEEAERDLRGHITQVAGAEVTVLSSSAMTPTAKQRKLVEDTSTVPPDALVAAEFGYKACEKGMNIQMMFSEFSKVWKGEA